MKGLKFCLAALLNCVFLVMLAGSAWAIINGPCSACHTMHNSQGNSPMRYDNSVTPLPQLLRGDCYGCHAQGTANALVSVGIDVIPQVYHNDPAVDLAGGNFAYINGDKGSGAADSKGHNINGLRGMTSDGTLYAPPGGIPFSNHDNGFNINTDILTCAGTNGCHGNRYDQDPTPYDGITGAHHDNLNGAIDYAVLGAADKEPGHGYRFLLGVNGYEDTDWQYTSSPTDHNEYFGRATPVEYDSGCAIDCHGIGGVRPPNNTMAEYCSTCHGNFHTLSGVTENVTATSPFIRHPSDLSIPNSGEFTAYTSYQVNTPVARLTVPAGSSSNVTLGSDAVFCLSCHKAHGSDYPDMLKWDYATMQVGNGGAATGTGCFACHSNKD